MVDQLRLLRALQKKRIPVLPFVAGPQRIADIGLPAVITAPQRGGDGFRAVVARYSDYAPAMALAYAHSPLVMVQRYIAGDEFACGVMKHEGRLVSLMPIEALPRARHETLPWHIPERRIEEIQTLALQAHKAVRAGAYSSVRCVISPSAEIYVVGVESCPSLTKTSLFMRSATAVGFTVTELQQTFQKFSKR